MDKIVLCSNNDKRMQLINSIETYAFGKIKSEKVKKKKLNVKI